MASTTDQRHRTKPTADKLRDDFKAVTGLDANIMRKTSAVRPGKNDQVLSTDVHRYTIEVKSAADKKKTTNLLPIKHFSQNTYGVYFNMSLDNADNQDIDLRLFGITFEGFAEFWDGVMVSERLYHQYITDACFRAYGSQAIHNGELIWSISEPYDILENGNKLRLKRFNITVIKPGLVAPTAAQLVCAGYDDDRPPPVDPLRHDGVIKCKGTIQVTTNAPVRTIAYRYYGPPQGMLTQAQTEPDTSQTTLWSFEKNLIHQLLKPVCDSPAKKFTLSKDVKSTANMTGQQLIDMVQELLTRIECKFIDTLDATNARAVLHEIAMELDVKMISTIKQLHGNENEIGAAIASRLAEFYPEDVAAQITYSLLKKCDNVEDLAQLSADELKDAAAAITVQTEKAQASHHYNDQAIKDQIVAEVEKARGSLSTTSMISSMRKLLITLAKEQGVDANKCTYVPDAPAVTVKLTLSRLAREFFNMPTDKILDTLRHFNTSIDTEYQEDVFTALQTAHDADISTRVTTDGNPPTGKILQAGMLHKGCYVEFCHTTNEIPVFGKIVEIANIASGNIPTDILTKYNIADDQPEASPLQPNVIIRSKLGTQLTSFDRLALRGTVAPAQAAANAAKMSTRREEAKAAKSLRRLKQQQQEARFEQYCENVKARLKQLIETHQGNEPFKTIALLESKVIREHLEGLRQDNEECDIGSSQWDQLIEMTAWEAAAGIKTAHDATIELVGESTDKWTSLRKLDSHSTLQAWCEAVYQAASQTPDWNNWHVAVCFAIMTLHKELNAEQAMEELSNMSAIDPADPIIKDITTKAHQCITSNPELCKKMITDEVKVSEQEWAKLRTCNPQIITDILASIAATDTRETAKMIYAQVKSLLPPSQAMPTINSTKISPLIAPILSTDVVLHIAAMRLATSPITGCSRPRCSK